MRRPPELEEYAVWEFDILKARLGAQLTDAEFSHLRRLALIVHGYAVPFAWPPPRTPRAVLDSFA